MIQSTDRECHLCEGTYVYYHGELMCSECSFAPDAPSKMHKEDSWERFWNQREQEILTGDRPRMVGGYAHAYR